MPLCSPVLRRALRWLAHAGCHRYAARMLIDLALITLGAAALTLTLRLQQRSHGWLRLWLALPVVLLALLHGLHLWPGYGAWPIWQGVSVKACSLPAYWTLHLDKAVAGIILLLGLRGLWLSPLPGRALHLLALSLGGAALVLGLAWLTGFIRWQMQLPPYWAVWLLANLLLTVLAEEALFRGFLQRELGRLFSAVRRGEWYALGLTAALFGLAHAGGGWLYASLAGMAGLVYGGLWLCSRTLFWPVLAHALVNAGHFLLFTWPAASVDCPAL